MLGSSLCFICYLLFLSQQITWRQANPSDTDDHEEIILQRFEAGTLVQRKIFNDTLISTDIKLFIFIEIFFVLQMKGSAN